MTPGRTADASATPRSFPPPRAPARQAAAPAGAAIIASPVGRLEVACSARGVTLVGFLDAADPRPTGVLSRSDPAAAAILDVVLAELGAYFAGTLRDFTVALDPGGTEFQREAWDALRTIPYGATISYEEQARRLHRPGAQRAVGRANATNHIAIIIPCHRVIEKSGGLRGYGGGLYRKQWLLDHERSIAGEVLFRPFA